MFSKAVTVAVIALSFSIQAYGHAAIAPVLGVAGTPKRSDVQRPSANAACGKTNVASTIDTSTPVVAAADGTFTVTATNFNAGRDGSRQVTMTVDAAGTGKNFVAGTVSQNGQAAPQTTGSEQIVASLPAGTTCTGGKAGNLCLASFKTLGGFGNCVVVQQGAAGANATSADAGAAGANATSADAGAAGAGAAAGAVGAAGGKAAAGGNGAATGAAAGNTAPAATGAKTTKSGSRKSKLINAAKNFFGNAAGTRAPRALRADIEARGEVPQLVKRGVMSWMWL